MPPHLANFVFLVEMGFLHVVQASLPAIHGLLKNVICPYSRILFIYEKECVRIQATIWMYLKNMMLNEKCQTQEAAYCISPFTCNAQRQIYRDRK